MVKEAIALTPGSQYYKFLHTLLVLVEE